MQPVSLQNGGFVSPWNRRYCLIIKISDSILFPKLAVLSHSEIGGFVFHPPRKWSKLSYDFDDQELSKKRMNAFCEQEKHEQFQLEHFWTTFIILILALNFIIFRFADHSFDHSVSRDNTLSLHSKPIIVQINFDKDDTKMTTVWCFKNDRHVAATSWKRLGNKRSWKIPMLDSETLTTPIAPVGQKEQKLPQSTYRPQSWSSGGRV